nr:uncharacterized protein LOC113804469 [Penaeus vannamei]
MGESELDALEYDKLLELFVLEEVKKSMPVKVRSHIDERGLRTLAEVGKAADHFALTNPNYSCRSNEPSFQSIQHNGKRMEYSSRRTGLPDTHRTVHTKSETGGDESKKVASRGFLSVDESCKSSSPVTILRDSAADISLVLKEMVPNPDCYTGEMIIINGLVGSKSIPICKVYLESKLITGYVNLGVVDNIPSDGISLLMGNDLVGDKVWPCPVVSPCPTEENNTVDLERSIPISFLHVLSPAVQVVGPPLLPRRLPPVLHYPKRALMIYSPRISPWQISLNHLTKIQTFLLLIILI